MMKMKDSKMTKVISGVVGLATAVMMMGPAVVSAATVEELTAQINALMAQLQSAQGGSSTASASSCSYVFSSTLKQGVTSSEVKNLQMVLNMDASTQVAASGVGSKGMESSYFGAMTKAAVVKFQEKYASDILTPNGLTKGTGLVGASTRAKLNAMCKGTTTGTGTGTTGTTATGTSAVSAMLDMSSPASTALLPGTSAKVAVFKLMNSGSSAAKIVSVKLKRTGVASDSALRNVYLYSGSQRITDSATVASGVVNFSDNSGIVTIPAGGTIALGVMVELDGTNALASNVIGLTLTDVVADTGTVAGLPVAAASHTVVQAPSDIATVYFNNTTNPVTGTDVDPQVDYVVWQNTVQVGSRDAMLSMIRFRQTGSVSAGDLANFRLYVGGTQVGSAVDKVGGDGYVTFDLSASPVVLKSGGRELKVLADIIGGSNKTFAFSLQQAVDATFWDSQLNVVLQNHTGGPSSAFTPVQAPASGSSPNVNTVKQGALTITKSTDSPSGNVINQGSGVTLAKYDFKGTGERLKVENLIVGFTSSDSSVGSIRNGALFVNGVQVGSTATIATTTFNLGSSLVLEPGKTTVVEVRGDVFDNNGSNDLSNGDTVKIILGAGSSNVYKMSSYGYVSYPASAVSANSLTVTDGSLTLSKYTAMANQTVTVPQTAYKIGEYRITAGATEGVNLSSFTLNFGSSTGSAASDLQDVYLVYGTKTTSVKSTVTSSGNTYSVNEPIAANSTMSVAVYATLNTSLSTNTITSSLSITGTSQNAGNSVSTGSVLGQTITGGVGTFTAVLDASTPVSAQVVGNSMPKVASFKFTGLYDNFNITELWFNATGSAAIAEIVVKDGSTEVKRQAFNGTDLRMTGLSVPVANNQNKVLDVYANLGQIGTGNASTSQNVAVALYGMKYRGSTGSETTTGGPGSGNAFYAFKTKPTIANVALPTTVLAAGTQTIGKFTITADAGGTVAWRKIAFNVATSGVTATNFRIYDSANESTILNGTSAVTSVDMNGRVTFTSTSDQEVSGSKTYVVKADVGAVATGNSISTSIPALGSVIVPNSYATVAASAGSFIWSDESVIGHDGTTADWSNDYLVKNLPTDSQTLTK